MICPNPSCERSMRLINGSTRKALTHCSHCGRRYPDPKAERFDLPYWLCDNCDATVWAPEELNLLRVTYGAAPKCEVEMD
jgi:ribosomal protein L37AE/L43A